MTNYRLDDGGFIQNPESKTNDDIYKVEVFKDTLTISLPHIESYVTALNEAREYEEKYNNLRVKYEKMAPQLQRDRSILQAILDNLKYLPRESREFSGIKKFIVDIDNILRK